MAYNDLPPLGQDTMSDSLPVVIASDQSAVPISAASLPLPTGAGTSANQTTIIGHLDGVEGLLTTIDADTSNISTKIDTLAGAVSGTEMQVDVLTLPSFPAGTNNIGDVDVLSVIPGTGATNLGKAEDAAHTTGDTGVFSLGVANEAQSSFGADGDYTPQATDVKGNTMNVGNIAHDTADAGNPLKIGGKAVSAEPTAVTANDRVNALFDLVGKLIVLPYANPENFVSGAITSAMTGTTSTSLVAAPGSGLRNYITQITISNAHATVGTDVIIQDGSGGTTLYTIPAAAVYGGATVTFPVPLRQPTTNTALYVANVTTGASTKASASGYKGV